MPSFSIFAYFSSIAFDNVSSEVELVVAVYGKLPTKHGKLSGLYGL
jgi:hypothetical protein